MLSATTLSVTLHMLSICEATCIPPMGNVSYVLGMSRKQYSTSTDLSVQAVGLCLPTQVERRANGGAG